MTTRCWVVNAARDNYSLYFCAENAAFRPQGGGVTVIADGADIFHGSWIYSNSTLIDGGGSIPPATYSNVSGSCSSCPPPATKYDCVNGTCTLKSVYNTPGIYNSLADCQAVCANGGACASGKQCIDPTTFCPDGKVCIDQGEFSSIEALISKINSEVC